MLCDTFRSPSPFFAFSISTQSIDITDKIIFLRKRLKAGILFALKVSNSVKANKHPGDPVNPVQEQPVKIAIPLFKDRVSPHFGASSTFLLVETDGTTICREATWNLPGEGPMEIARRLADLGIEELICGGIQSHCKNWLISKGIKVVDNQKGRVREVVEALFGKKSHL